MQHRRTCRVLAAALLLAPAAAGAEPLLARYEVRAAGFTVMQVAAVIDLEGPRYRVTTRIRTTGVVGALSRGDQVTSVEGRWAGPDPVPVRYRLEGTWRGARRAVAIDYPIPGEPTVLTLEPPNLGEREEVPATLRLRTMDALSALAKLTRAVADTGRCDTMAAVFDGRRRADYTAQHAGVERLPADGAIAGEALRCTVDGRVLAGFRDDQDRAAARDAQPATAWLARVPGGGPALPVRVDMPSRWFGTIRVTLLGVGPAPASALEFAEHRR